MVVVHAFADGHAVNLLDDAARGNAFHGQGAALDDLLNAQAVAVVVRVEEHAYLGGLLRRAVRVVACPSVRGVQLAQHLAQHVAEVVFVVDVGQELAVHLAVGLPVHAVQLGVVELVLHLLPDVVEQVLPLLVGTVVERCLEAHVLALALAQIHFLDAAGTEVEVLEVLVGLHDAAAHALQHQLGLLLQEVVLPQVGLALKARLVVQRVASWREHVVAQVAGVGGQPHNAVAAVVEHLGFEFKLRLLVLLAFPLVLLAFRLFVFRLFALTFLLVLLTFIEQRLFLLRHAETIVGIQVEEHQVDVALGSPAAVTAESGTVALEEHGLAAQCPFGSCVAVAAVGQVAWLQLALRVDQRNVAVVPAARANVRC